MRPTMSLEREPVVQNELTRLSELCQGSCYVILVVDSRQRALTTKNRPDRGEFLVRGRAGNRACPKGAGLNGKNGARELRQAASVQTRRRGDRARPRAGILYRRYDCGSHRRADDPARGLVGA